MALQREDVVRAALRLVDEVGLDGLTMRRLATYLNIQGPSLYWHFTSKQEILNGMAEVIMADAFVDLRPPEAHQDWASWVAEFARLLRRMSLAHRDGARTLAEADLTFGPFLSGVDLAVQVLHDAGFEARTALASVLTILNYVLGGAFELQADPAHSPQSEKVRSMSLGRHFVELEHFPTLARLVNETDLPLASTDAWFEEGLRLLLDGMQVALARATAHLQNN